MGKVQEVFYQYYSKGNEKYFKAPFCLYHDTDGTYIIRGGDGVSPSVFNVLSDSDADKRKCVFCFDEIIPEPLIMGEHELGDFDGNADNWKGVFKFPLGC